MHTDVTILLTLYKRHEFTERWLDFLSDQGCRCKIIVADGNSTKSETEKIIGKDKFKDLDIFHFWTKEDCGPKDYLHKILRTLEQVASEYLIVADNDDLIDVNQLLENVQDAKNQNLKVGVCGQYRFTSKGNKTTFEKLMSFKLLNSSDIDLRKKRQLYISSFQSDYMSYAIVSSDLYTLTIQKMIEADFDKWIYLEMTQTYVYSEFVNQKQLLEPYLYRQENTSILASSLVDTESFNTIIFHENFPQNIKKIKKIIDDINPLGELNEVGLEIERFIINKIINRVMVRRYRNYRFLINIIKYLFVIKNGKYRKRVFMKTNFQRKIERFLSSSDV